MKIAAMLQIIRTYINYLALPCFILSGLVLNIVQLIAYILIRPFNKNLFREINHYLNYSCWSQTVAIAEWNTNFKCRIYFKDDPSLKEFGTISGLALANHRYDTDWLATWLLVAQFDRLGQDKAMLKSSLRYVPVFGWGCSLSDMIFLSRNWQKDKENLIKSMDILLTYPNSLILGFFEGTRFTPVKYEASLKFAEEKNLTYRPKHHLVPRTRGFNCMTRRVKERMQHNSKLKYGLYNVQIAVDDDDNDKATLTSVLAGVETCVHVYVERLDIRDVPVESEDAASNYLFEVYTEKDRLHEYFKKNGKFPGIEVGYRPRIATLLNWASWMFITYATVIYQYYICFASGNLFWISILTTVALVATLGVKMLVNSTKVSKSSNYGTRVGKNESRKD